MRHYHGVPGEIKRREVELDLKVSPKEIMSREVELGCESWTSFTWGCSSTAVQRTLCMWLCPSTVVETAIARCTSRWVMARGHRLDTSIVLVVPRSLQSFSGDICGSAFTLSSPPPPVPVPNKQPCFCGCKAIWSICMLCFVLINCILLNLLSFAWQSLHYMPHYDYYLLRSTLRSTPFCDLKNRFVNCIKKSFNIYWAELYCALQ